MRTITMRSTSIRVITALALVGLLLLPTGRAYAVIASPHPFEVTQPDGAIVKLNVRGDERYHWQQDLEGYTVVKNNSGWYVYARQNTTGELAPTNLIVGKADPAASGIAPGVMPAREVLKQITANAYMVSPSLEKSASKIGTIGTLKNLVIPIRFSDHATRTLPSQSDLNTLFNAVGGDPVLAPTGSIRDVYNENSYGQLTLESTVVDWVDVSRTEAYCAAGNSAETPTKLWEALLEALSIVDADIDFRDFDVDGDGAIDGITFLHSGYGAEWDEDPDHIWSHRSTIFPAWVGNEGVEVSDYHISTSLWGTSGSEIGRIGVIAHEMGHFLGLPDLYDIDGSGGEGIGSFGMMANPWGFDGEQLYPPNFCGWSKIELGWLIPQDIDDPGVFTANPVHTKSQVYRIDYKFATNEYLLIENWQPKDEDDPMTQGGLVIYHIDDNYFNESSGMYEEGYPEQTGWPENGNHYRVAVLQADGFYELEKGGNRGDAGDVFHGADVDVLLPDTSVFPSTASYRPNDYKSTGWKIFNISNADPLSGAIEFSILNQQIAIEAPVITAPNNGNDYVTKYDTAVTVSGTCNALAQEILINLSTDTENGFSSTGVTFTPGTTTWSYASDTLVEGPNGFGVKARDDLGKLSEAENIYITYDPNALDTPVITAPNGGSDYTTSDPSPVTLSGTCDPDSDIIRVNNSTSGVTYTSGASVWEYTSGTLSEGQNIFRVVSEDISGNLSMAGVITITLDTTPPEVPEVTSPEITVDGKYITKETTPQVLQGSCAGDTNAIFVNGSTARVSFTPGTTSWSYTSESLAEGEHLFEITARDAVGNTSQPASFTIIVDLTPPVIAINESDYETNSTDPITLTGTCSTDVNAVFVNLETSGVTVAGDGTWSFTSGSLSQGDNLFSVTCTDYAGNTSNTDTITIAVDSVAPEAPVITAPQSGADYYTNQQDPVLIAGTCAADTAKMLVNGSTTGVTYIAGDTAWSYTSDTLVAGANTFEVLAEDAAGNQSEPNSITITLDQIPPIVLVTAPSTTGSTAVAATTPLLFEGTTDADTVSMEVTGAAGGGAYTAGETEWSFMTQTLSEGDNSFQITATDRANNVSNPASFTVIVDTIPPVGTIQIVEADPGYVYSTFVDLLLSFSDGGGTGVTQMRFSNDNFNWLPWEWDTAPAAATTFQGWELKAGEDGLRQVYVQFRDLVGNVSLGRIGDEVTLETCDIFDVELLSPKANLAVPPTVAAVTLPLAAKVTVDDETLCQDSVLSVTYAVDGSAMAISQDAENNYPASIALAPRVDEYLIAAVGEIQESAKSLSRGRLVSVRTLSDGNGDGYADDPFELVDSEVWQAEVITTDGIRTVVMVGWEGASSAKAEEADDYITAIVPYPLDVPLQYVTVRVPRDLIAAGEQANLIVTVAPELGAVWTSGKDAAQYVPGKLLESALFVDVTIIVTSDGGATYYEVNTLGGGMTAEVEILGVGWEQGTAPAMYLHPSDITFTPEQSIIQIDGATGAWTSVQLESGTDAVKATASVLGTFVPSALDVEAPILNVSPGDTGSFDYGGVLVDGTEDQAFAIVNVGGGTLSGEAQILDDATGAFMIVGTSTYDITTENATVTVRFAPAEVGAYTATLLLDNDGGDPVTVTLQGNGILKPTYMGVSCAPGSNGNTVGADLLLMAAVVMMLLLATQRARKAESK